MRQPDFLDDVTELRKRVEYLEAHESKAFTRGTLVAYDRATNTATVSVGGVEYAGVRVASTLGCQPWAIEIGGEVGVVGFSSGTPANGVIVYAMAIGLPWNALDPIMGHRHRPGLEDDGGSPTG